MKRYFMSFKTDEGRIELSKEAKDFKEAVGIAEAIAKKRRWDKHGIIIAQIKSKEAR